MVINQDGVTGFERCLAQIPPADFLLLSRKFRAPFGLPAEGALGSGQNGTRELHAGLPLDFASFWTRETRCSFNAERTPSLK